MADNDHLSENINDIQLALNRLSVSTNSALMGMDEGNNDIAIHDLRAALASVNTLMLIAANHERDLRALLVLRYNILME